MQDIEFIVEGPPISFQTKNKARLQTWKAQVKDAAITVLTDKSAPTSSEVCFKVTYYYDTDSPDVDNILKPIQDALVGLVFLDDNQVVESTIRKRRIDGAYKIKAASPLILKGFINAIAFLHIKVEKFQNTQELD